ncbi:MAG: hypothetical protein VW239_10215, partial [Candidatus Nanopelagicales bacterium]
MSALAVTNPTLLDLAKAMDPDGKISTVVEILEEMAPELEDMTVIEGNLSTGHQTTIRTGLPAPTWRKLYGGVQPTKGTVAKITDTCGSLEAYSEIDKDLAELNGNKAAFRLLEDRAHLEGMTQEMSDTLFYGNESTEPEAFTGLSPRFNVRSGVPSADNVIHGGSSDTDNGSIWLVVWGPDTIHGIVPKGSKAGFTITDKGIQTLETAPGGGGKYEAYVTHYQWKLGLCVRDWRYAVRICNIDKSALTKDAASGADLPDLMFQAMRLIPNLNRGRPVFYMSRDMVTTLSRQTANLTK